MSESERAILSQLLIAPEIAASVTLAPEHFSNARYGHIYKTIQAMIDCGLVPDMLTLSQRLPEIPRAEIADISGAMPSAANWEYHQGRIMDAWKLSRIRMIAREVIESRETADEIVASVEAEITKIAMGYGKRKIEKVGDLVLPFLVAQEERYEKRGRLLGMSTGFETLDDMTQGLRPRLLYVIGGRPSQGKSALGLNMAIHQAVTERKSVGFLSLESSSREIISRAVSAGANISARSMQTGFVAMADMSRISDYAEHLYDARLYIWDQPNAALPDVKAIARQMKRAYDVKALYVDYLQLIKVPGSKERRDAVAEASMGLKELARELEIPIVVLAQLNRDSDNRRPSMGDFQWSSQIEQDADVAMLLYHKMPEEAETLDDAESYILVDKCRDGRRGKISVCFDGEHVRFIEKAKIGLDKAAPAMR